MVRVCVCRVPASMFKMWMLVLFSFIVTARCISIHTSYGGGFEAAGYNVGYNVYPSKPRQAEKEQQQDFSKIPGVPGVDYPIYHSVPETSFSCHNVPAHPGIYANVETGCQAYHVCHDGREGHQGASFLCTNGTLFNQAEFNCDWWYNVHCHDAPNLYRLNLDPLKNPYAPKPKAEEEKYVEEQKY